MFVFNTGNPILNEAGEPVMVEEGEEGKEDEEDEEEKKVRLALSISWTCYVCGGVAAS